MNNIATVGELDRRFGIPSVAIVSEGKGAMARVKITSSLCEGEIYLHGAQVTSWKPANADEVLFLSGISHWEEGQAIRGGIPICFPWFRAKIDDVRAPAHGFVRTKAWQLVSIVETGSGVAVSMSTESDESTQPWWPAQFRLVLSATFGSELTLDLVCTNTGTTPFTFEEALHTYNRVANIRNVLVHGLETVRFLDNTDLNHEKVQNGDIAITSQTDNAYLDASGPVELEDPDMGRRIRLRKVNSLTTVVWNPWREGASTLHDLGEDEWTKFACVEASNILGAGVRLAHGQEHRMTAVVSVAKL